MIQMSASQLQALGTRLLDAAGSPHDESEWVSESLVHSSLRGYDSHGVMRFPQYVGYIQRGIVNPGAPFEIKKETSSIAVVDGHFGWGQVVARKAMELAIDKAKQCAVGTVVVTNSQHVGRLGEYPALAASRGMIGLAIINLFGGKEIEEVAPWGGIDPKLAPNPIAWAAPCSEDWPIVFDMTTSVVPEGKVRLAKYKGRELPEGCIIDSNGLPTTNPNDFYGNPGGALLPLGGLVGHKGYGLALMTEVFAGALSGAGCAGQKRSRSGNGLFFEAINISEFLDAEEFNKTVQGLRDWIKTSRKKPGFDEILLPGEQGQRTHDQRLKEGIPVDDDIWREIESVARDLHVEI
jgi:uncharacterized oxidoreductase